MATSPFLSLPRGVFGGEIHVLASHVVYIEIALSSTTAQLVLGLTSGRTIESPVYEPTDKTLETLREYRDTIFADLSARLSDAGKPAYAQLPESAR